MPTVYFLVSSSLVNRSKEPKKMAPDWMQGKQLKSEHSQPIEQICEPIKVEQNRMPKNIIKQLMNRVNLNLQI
jgi:hypothetical protein